ncbi:aldehyde dehydrogenase family protein [Flavobacteriaceae bacterium LMO-SS05]
MKANSNNAYIKVFNVLKSNQYSIGNTTYKERIKKLNALKEALEFSYKQRIREALYSDFKKPFLETDFTEIYPVIDEINFVKRNLKSWLKKQRVDTPLTLLGSSSWIKHEPKGVCLILSPWNFPVNLTFGPLVSAIAAGNTVVLKPSEMTPNASKVMSSLVKEVFKEDEVVLIEGEADTAQELLKLPFNHIFFTGSPSVGKLVMKAASENLASVTLELGGKSPTIIDDTAYLEKAVKKTIFGKFLNAGQTCIAPDYILINEKIKKDFVASFSKQIKTFYSENPETSKSLSRIVNKKHFNRVVLHLEDAISKKAVIEVGGSYNQEDRFLEPTLISGLPEHASLLQEEIFGPILPLVTYKTIEDAVNYINAKEKPLSLYIFSKNRKQIDFILNNTRAGSTAINHNLLQFLNPNLPFGGSNNSGIGKSHGFFGFQEFSNQRSILKQHTFGAVDLLYPPYNMFKQKIVDLTIKWF